jgi:hypothetical protein
MTKKRRSLQSIFIPSFLQHSPPLAGSASALAQGNMSRMRSYSSASLSVQCSDSTLRQVETSVISPRNSPPPEFLLDDDPFANLSLAPSRSAAFSTRRTLHPPDPDTPYVIPRSLLSPTDAPGSSKASTSATSVTTPPSPTSLATLMRTQSFGSTLARSAHKKPAFSPRPSLPSLHTLAQVNVVIPKKVCEI